MVSAGFGLWLDYDRPKLGWKTGDLEQNYFSPDRFETSLRAAVEQSDEFVWIYTETPRWWSQEGGASPLGESSTPRVARRDVRPSAASPLKSAGW